MKASSRSSGSRSEAAPSLPLSFPLLINYFMILLRIDKALVTPDESSAGMERPGRQKNSLGGKLKRSVPSSQNLFTLPGKRDFAYASP